MASSDELFVCLRHVVVSCVRTVGIWRRLLLFQHLHVANIVNIQVGLEHHDQALPVQAHSQNTGSKSHLAYCGVSLRVLYAQDAGRQGEGDQRGGEEHFETGDISFARLGLLVEGIGGVDAVAFGGACGVAKVSTDSPRPLLGEDRYAPTPRWLWSWLKVTKFMDVILAGWNFADGSAQGDKRVGLRASVEGAWASRSRAGC